MHSPDLSQDNIAKIRALFPDCVTEAADDQGTIRLAIDFDQLRQQLSDHIVEGPQERYRLDWPGKREALLTANAPIAKTLRPARNESVDFDATQNLFIEGDNLDALKLLQESYLGKVKLIYIDPPYNTGSDFVYFDDFRESVSEFLTRSNQEDKEGGRLIANTESNGRFHSDWLTMIYPRLRIARNMLSADGIMLISIDNNEFSNLKVVCDEIFGQDSLVGIFKWNRTSKAPTLSKKIRNKYEYILCYEKSDVGYMRGPDSYNSAAPLFNSGNQVSKLKFDAGSVQFSFPDCTCSAGVYGASSKAVTVHNDIIVKDGVNANSFEMSARFKWSQSTMNERISGGQCVFFKTPKLTTMYYSLDVDAGNFIAPSDILNQDECGVLRNDEGYAEIMDLFNGEPIFDYAKPLTLLQYFCKMIDDQDAIVLDFFAGSATTAHAVLAQNAADGGNRKFIMVQVPEETEENSVAYKADFQTISAISKERIRRAGKKVLQTDCHVDWNRDVGFRVLQIDSSNMTDVYYRPDEVKQDELYGQIDSVKPDRTAEDLLFQVLIDWGVELTLPINRETLHGKTVYSVDGNALIACFEPGVTDDLVKDIAARAPLRAVFRDTSFARDADRINAEQLFRQLSPGTELKAI